MITLEDILKLAPEKAVAALKVIPEGLPTWETLSKEYETKEHPVMNKGDYPDLEKDGKLEKVTRITVGFQKLSVKRASELCFAIPVKRIYNAQTDREKEIAAAIEKIFKKNRINSVNIERGRMYFASCQAATLWFATEEDNNLYGFDSKLKLRCRSYSPIDGESIYPLFDSETDDMIALSFGYTRKEDKKDVEYLDTYTADKHIRYKKTDNWDVDIEEQNTLGKIPAVYLERPEPIWEDSSNNIYEVEWALSRNGNYIRKNSKPILGLFADEEVEFNKQPDEKETFKDVFQYPKGSDLKYVTWQQAIENLKYFVSELKQNFWTQLQLPDLSYENMKSAPMSGEARLMMFIDAMLKVTDESGKLLEAFDREINIVKAFLKLMNPSWKNDIDALQVECEITPFTIRSDKDTVDTIMSGTAGKAIISRREGIKMLNWSDDVDKTLQDIQDEEKADSFSLTD